MLNIKGVEILGLTINLLGERDPNAEYDFGALTLKCEGREFILDICQTNWDESTGDCEIRCDLEIDKDVFEDCKYDLEAIDLYSDNLVSEVFIGGTFSNIIDNMTLFIRQNQSTKAINVIQE